MPRIIDFKNITTSEPQFITHETKHTTNENKSITDKVVLTNTSLEENKQMIDRIYPNKILFTIQELAGIINTSYEFIRRNIANGNIPAIRYGDRKMISQTTVVNLLTYGV